VRHTLILDDRNGTTFSTLLLREGEAPCLYRPPGLFADEARWCVEVHAGPPAPYPPCPVPALPRRLETPTMAIERPYRSRLNGAVADLAHQLTAPDAPGGRTGSMSKWRVTRVANDLDEVEVTFTVSSRDVDLAILETETPA
jgi:hypothetical protein